MATNTVKGARYITKFADPIEWDSTRAYEAIESVQHNGFTYISKQPVPSGVQIDNEAFWLLWADPNAQMEQLRQLVETYGGNVEELSRALSRSETELTNEIENRETADTALSNKIEAIKTDYQSYNIIAYGTDEFEFIKNLDIPTNHTVQGICFNGGYLFVFHHLNDTSPAFISKFDTNNDFSRVDSLELPKQMHTNGMCYDSNTGCLILCDTRTRGLHFVTTDLVYKNVLTSFDTSATLLSAFAVTANGNIAYGNITSSNSYVIYEKHGEGFCAIGKTIPDSIGSSGRQDMTDVGNYGFAHLCSIVGSNVNVRNIIKVFSAYGTPYVTFTFPSTEEELEGLSYDSASHKFFIVGLNGQLYTLDASSFFGASIVNLNEPKYAGNWVGFWILPSNNYADTYLADYMIYENGKGTIQRFVQFPNIDRYISVSPVIFSFPTGAYMGNGTAGANLRCQANYLSGTDQYIYTVGYNIGTGNRHYLNQIYCYNIATGDKVSKTFTESETTESVLGKIAEIETAGFPIRGTTVANKFGPQRWGAAIRFDFGFLPFNIVNVEG